MMIIGSDEVIQEITNKLKSIASEEWYHNGEKEFDADVKIIHLNETEEFHLG